MGTPKDQTFTTSTVCVECHQDVPACPEHKRVDLLWSDDEDPIYNCGDCCSEYGTAFGSIIHFCSFLSRMEYLASPQAQKDLEKALREADL